MNQIKNLKYINFHNDNENKKYYNWKLKKNIKVRIKYRILQSI